MPYASQTAQKYRGYNMIDIDNLLQLGIGILEKIIMDIRLKQTLNTTLTKGDFDQINECLKTLVIVKRDGRQAEKEEILDTKGLSDEELNQKILAEASKILKI